MFKSERYTRPDIIRIKHTDIEMIDCAVFIEDSITGEETIMDNGKEILVLPDIPLYLEFRDGEYWVSKNEGNIRLD